MKLDKLFACFATFAFVCCGCGKNPSPPDLPSLVPFSVEITQEGSPLPGAFVSLHATAPAFKWSVGAVTDANGVAKLSTHAQYPGVPVGEYKVVVVKTESQEQTDRTVLFNLLETEYMNVETTPLTVKVEQGGGSRTFDVGKAVRKQGETVVF